MRKRIIRHLNQRSEMLSGISHDLRTPLTRIKLQLAFIKDKELSNKLSDDVIEMEKMLNEYLQFSKNRSSEKGKKFNLSKLLTDTIKKYNNKNISTEISPNILFHGKKSLINRCISNILDNSLKYGKIIKLKLKKAIIILLYLIDDDGPGIPKNEYENVFKPFYKIDKSRSETKSSVGLGMSIASDIIQSHGGNIKLDKSNMKGFTGKNNFTFLIFLIFFFFFGWFFVSKFSTLFFKISNSSLVGSSSLSIISSFFDLSMFKISLFKSLYEISPCSNNLASLSVINFDFVIQS